MGKREFLQLAHVYDPKKHGIAGWFASEKLDGMRALWDGGITRGMLCADVPWANTEKHARFKVQPVSTGLWTRYGQPIHAPAYFLNALPKCILDGELYAGRNRFQHVVSATKKHEPILSEWEPIRYMVFDSPNPHVVFGPGKINNTNFKKTIPTITALDFFPRQRTNMDWTFQQRLKFLLSLQDHGPVWTVHDQMQLLFKTADAIEIMEVMLDNVLKGGGEGLILKSPSNIWLPERQHDVLKVKNCQDAEGTVIGYVWGKRTGLGSKLLGLMGGLILKQDNGKELEISGFTNEEREMAWCEESTVEDWGKDVHHVGASFAGQKVQENIHNPMFPRGTRITYKFRELTDDGVAKEARYHRIKTDE